MCEKVKSLVEEAITFSGLPITSGGARDDAAYHFGWSGRRIDGVLENFIAEIFIGARDAELGVVIEVRALGYQENTRDVYGRLYWENTITPDALEERSLQLRAELEAVFVRVWNELPELHIKMLKNKEGHHQLLDHLRRVGLLSD